VFTPWLDDDTQSAEYWVRSAEPSTEIDALIRVIIRRYFDRRPDLAMEWAHLLNDPAVRTRVKTSVGRAWYRKNRDAFMAWLPESGLESQVRDLILNTPMAP
jgi:3-deoxy-D-arabino-heptulosonate 7-phosphate (DAHP) synthase